MKNNQSMMRMNKDTDAKNLIILSRVLNNTNTLKEEKHEKRH
jgi:hypothetical protein